MPLKVLKALQEMDDADFSNDDPSSVTTFALKPDTGLARAMLEVARVIAEFKIPEEKEPPEPKEGPDYTKQMDAIARGLSQMGMIAAAVGSLRQDLSSLAMSIKGMKSADVSGLVDAVNAIATSQKQLSQALTAPRSLTFDKNGEPIGIEIERMN